MASFVKILGYNKDIKNYQNIACSADGNLTVEVNKLKFDETGALITSFTGNAIAGDASSALQQVQIGIASNSNIATISSLGTINTSLGTLNGKFTSSDSNLMVFDTQANEKLDIINTGIETLDNQLEIIDSSIETTNNKLDDVLENQINSNTATNEKLGLISEQINLTNVGIGEINGLLYNIDTNGQTTNGKLDLVATEGTLFVCQGYLEGINTNSAQIGSDLQALNSLVSTEATLNLVRDELITLNNLGIMTDATGQSIDASLLFTNEKLDILNSSVISSNTGIIDKLSLFQFDIDGNLKTTGSGGGGGGDATAVNQINSNLAICERLDTIITDYSTSPGLKTNLIAESYENPGSWLQLKVTETNNGLLIKDIDGPLESTQWASYELQQTQSTDFQNSNLALSTRIDITNETLINSNLSIFNQLSLIKSELETVANESSLAAIGEYLETNLIYCNTNDLLTETTYTESNIALCDRLDLINTSIENLNISGGGNSNVTILNSNLNTHIYGFHNSNWAPIKVNGVGHIICDASTQDGNGEAITSHLINTDRGLDTYIINPSIEVSNIWLSNIGSIDTKATTINTGIGQTNTILSGQTIQLNDIILETQTNNTKTQSIVDNTNTINSSIGTTNNYLASANILLDDIKTEQEATNGHLTTIESSLATIETTINTSTQKVSLYSASESPINATSNALNVYQTNNPTSINITASDTALTATSSALNVNQTNNPTSINITANDAALNATSGALNSYITNSKVPVIGTTGILGTFGNLWNNATIGSQGQSLSVSITNYTKSIITYEDGAIGSPGVDILVFARPVGGANYMMIGRLIPIVSSTFGRRHAYGVFELGPFDILYLTNNSTTSLNNAYATVISVN